MLNDVLRLRCPNCHTGKMYHSFLKVEERCTECDYPLADHDAGDGPVYFAICIVSVIATVLAVMVDFRYQPSWQVHLAIWPAFIMGLSLLCLIYGKAIFLHAHYHIRKKELEQ